MTKKVLCFFLVLICAFYMTACKSKDKTGDGDNNTSVKCVHDISSYEENKYKCTKCNVEFRCIYFDNIEKFKEETNKVVFNESLNQYYIVEDENVIMYDETVEKYYMYDVFDECPTIPTPEKPGLTFLWWEIISVDGVEVPEGQKFEPSKDLLKNNLVLKGIFVVENIEYPEFPDIDGPGLGDPDPENPDNEGVLSHPYNNATFTIVVESKDVQEVTDMLPGLGQGEVAINTPTMTFKVVGDKLYSCSGDENQKLETIVEFIKENNIITSAKVKMFLNGTLLGENIVTNEAEIAIYKNALNNNFIYFNDTLFTNVLNDGTTHGNEDLLKDILEEEFKEQIGEDYVLKNIVFNVYEIVSADGLPVKYELDYVAYLEHTFFYPEYKEVTIFITKYYNATITFTNVGTTVID